MTWTVEIQERVLRQLKRLGRIEAERIEKFLEDRVAGGKDPRTIGAALQGSKFEHLWRYRVGDYRIVCDIQDGRMVVLVLSVGHRREIYR